MDIIIAERTRSCLCCRKKIKPGTTVLCSRPGSRRGIICRPCLLERIPEAVIKFESSDTYKKRVKEVKEKNNQKEFNRDIYKELRKLLTKDLRQNNIICSLTHSGNEELRIYKIHLYSDHTHAGYKAYIILGRGDNIIGNPINRRSPYSNWDQWGVTEHASKLPSIEIPYCTPYDEIRDKIINWYNSL